MGYDAGIDLLCRIRQYVVLCVDDDRLSNAHVHKHVTFLHALSTMPINTSLRI